MGLNEVKVKEVSRHGETRDGTALSVYHLTQIGVETGDEVRVYHFDDHIEIWPLDVPVKEVIANGDLS